MAVGFGNKSDDDQEEIGSSALPIVKLSRKLKPDFTKMSRWVYRRHKVKCDPCSWNDGHDVYHTMDELIKDPLIFDQNKMTFTSVVLYCPEMICLVKDRYELRAIFKPEDLPKAKWWQWLLDRIPF